MFKVNEARMKAIRVHTPGGPEALRYEEIERPAPGPGQVLVKIEAAGVNFIDVYQRTGHYKVPLPVTLGQEAAGTVSAVGPRRGRTQSWGARRVCEPRSEEHTSEIQAPCNLVCRPLL